MRFVLFRLQSQPNKYSKYGSVLSYQRYRTISYGIIRNRHVQEVVACMEERGYYIWDPHHVESTYGRTSYIFYAERGRRQKEEIQGSLSTSWHHKTTNHEATFTYKHNDQRCTHYHNWGKHWLRIWFWIWLCMCMIWLIGFLLLLWTLWTCWFLLNGKNEWMNHCNPANQVSTSNQFQYLIIAVLYHVIFCSAALFYTLHW